MDRNGAFATLMLINLLGGFIGLSSRTLFGYGLEPSQVTCIRMVVTTLTMGVTMVLFNRQSLRIRAADIWFFIVFGVSKLLSDAFLFEAQSRIDLSLSAILQMIFPIYVLVMSHFMFDERVTRTKVVSMFLAFIGCILVTGPAGGMSWNDILGIVFALVSGLAMAVYTIGCRLGTDRGYGASTLLFYFYLVGALSTFLFVDTGGIVDTMVAEPSSVIHMLILGVLLTAVPYYLHIKTMEVLDPGTVSIVLLFEAVVAAAVGALFYQEYLSAVNMAGMALVFVSMVVLNRDDPDVRETSRRQ